MANHGYVTTKKHMSIEKIDADLREFISRHCGGVATVEGPFDISDELAGWLVKFLDDDYATFQVWLHTRRKLELPHPMGANVPYWAQTLFQHEMAAKYNGRVSDDGYEGHAKTDPDRINTYTKYVDLMLSHLTSKRAKAACRGMYNAFIDRKLKDMPSF